jgi:dGTPase
MDWADDIAYSVHDVEDGVRSGRISFGMLRDRTERAAVAELAAKHFSPEPVSALEDAAEDLLRLPLMAGFAQQPYDASLAAQVALKQLTSELVGRFATAAVAATRAIAGDGVLTRYAADLVVPPRVHAEVALLKAVAVRYVMSDERRLAEQAKQRELLAELLDTLARTAPGTLEPAFLPAWLAAVDDAARLRVLVDQTASLTDQQAMTWHRRLCNGREV